MSLKFGGFRLFNIIYCELLKLKKSYIVHIAFFAGIFISILMFFGGLMDNERHKLFVNYSSTIEMINIILLYTILFSLIAGYVFSREFTDKTASTLYAYSISRTKILIGKLIAIYILIFFVCLIRITSTYVGYYILTHTLPEGDFIFRHVKHSLYSLFFEFLLVPIPILVTNLTKNIIFPVVYGIIGTIAITTLGNRIQYFPLITPYKAIEKLYRPNLVDIKYSIISGVLCFIVSISICIYQYNKEDIA